MLTVDDYLRIRRMILVEGRSRREVSRKLGHSRRTISKALKHHAPPGYRRTQTPLQPAVGPYKGYIDAWLEQDKRQPRKQRHTAKRIYQRLRDEHEYTGSSSAVRRYVAGKKATSGDVFFPLGFDPGEEAQIDWGTVWAVLGGVQRKVMIFCMRLCYSTASYVRAYEREDQVSLLDGMARGFEFIQGVPDRCAADNMKSAVIRVIKGEDRELTDGYKEVVSYYLFQPRFCNVEAGWEKGHVENLVKHAQRTFLTPLPEAADLEALNDHLLKECEKDLDRQGPIKGRTRRELLAQEQQRMREERPLPRRFDACKKESTYANKQALVRFDTNDYSVPVRWAHHSVTLKGYVDRVELFSGGERISVHKRCYGAGEFILDPYHYIALLEKKPGGIHNARAFKGEPWGAEFTRMRTELEYRYGGQGIRKFVNILLLFSKFPEQQVKAAVKTCLRRGAFSDEAVQGVLNYVPPKRSGRLDLSQRPELALSGDGTRPLKIYDAHLLGKEVAGL